MWFSNLSGIARITPAGQITRFAGEGAGAPGIAAGPDGNMWFTNGSGIGRITPDGVTSIFEGGIRDYFAHAIAAGPDGSMWFVNGESQEGAGVSLGRITMSGVISFTRGYSVGIEDPVDLALGPDGNMWITDNYSNAIVRVTPGLVGTRFNDPAVSRPHSITPGPDGAMWFTADNRIWRITATGVFSSITLSNYYGYPHMIAAGPDGNIWAMGMEVIYRVTPAGGVETFATPVGGWTLAAGPDGNIWFTGFDDAIGFVGTGPPNTSPLKAYVLEGSVVERGGYLFFRIILNRPTTTKVSVRFATRSGTARANLGDYRGRAGTATFEPGYPSHSVDIIVDDDRIVEPDERLTLLISEPSPGLALGHGGATGWIRNDD